MNCCGQGVRLNFLYTSTFECYSNCWRASRQASTPRRTRDASTDEMLIGRALRPPKIPKFPTILRVDGPPDQDRPVGGSENFKRRGRENRGRSAARCHSLRAPGISAIPADLR